MTRDQAINKLVNAITPNNLAMVVANKTTEQPFNFSLLMTNALFLETTSNTHKNWFTGFAVLCINQPLFAMDLIGLTRITDGNADLSASAKKELIDAIAAGSKLTKADAGRGL